MDARPATRPLPGGATATSWPAWRAPATGSWPAASSLRRSAPPSPAAPRGCRAGRDGHARRAPGSLAEPGVLVGRPGDCSAGHPAFAAGGPHATVQRADSLLADVSQHVPAAAALARDGGGRLVLLGQRLLRP